MVSSYFCAPNSRRSRALASSTGAGNDKEEREAKSEESGKAVTMSLWPGQSPVDIQEACKPGRGEREGKEGGMDEGRNEF